MSTHPRIRDYKTPLTPCKPQDGWNMNPFNYLDTVADYQETACGFYTLPHYLHS